MKSPKQKKKVQQPKPETQKPKTKKSSAVSCCFGFWMLDLGGFGFGIWDLGAILVILRFFVRPGRRGVVARFPRPRFVEDCGSASLDAHTPLSTNHQPNQPTHTNPTATHHQPPALPSTPIHPSHPSIPDATHPPPPTHHPQINAHCQAVRHP